MFQSIELCRDRQGDLRMCQESAKGTDPMNVELFLAFMHTFSEDNCPVQILTSVEDARNLSSIFMFPHYRSTGYSKSIYARPNQQWL
jgi:hypothetical protein